MNMPCSERLNSKIKNADIKKIMHIRYTLLFSFISNDFFEVIYLVLLINSTILKCRIIQPIKI